MVTSWVYKVYPSEAATTPCTPERSISSHVALVWASGQEGMEAAVEGGGSGEWSVFLQGSWAYFNGQGQQWNDQEEKLLPLCISCNLISIIPCTIPFATGWSKHGPNQFYISV